MHYFRSVYLYHAKRSRRPVYLICVENYLQYAAIHFIFSNVRYSRISVLFYSFICVGLAIFMTSCVWSFCGLPLIAEYDTIFYLLLGLGLDDCFVLVQDYHQENLQSSMSAKPIPMEKRISRILSRGGVSITITSLTNALVFLIGYFSTSIDITVSPISCLTHVFSLRRIIVSSPFLV